MSKINIPTCTLPETECDILFNSIAEKLNIQNPRFHYPIYNKIVDNASDSRGLIFDSKFKVREILSKVLDSDSDCDDYETDDNNEATTISGGALLEKDKSSYTFNLEDSNQLESTTEDQDLQEHNILEDVLNTDQDIELVKAPNPEILDGDDANGDDANGDDDREIDEAINNIFSANATIERVNKTTGEKSIKEEQIHIKKSPLLEPLKVLKDEFLIPARLKNQSLANETLQRTRAKLDSYNNSAHVEALFLYLGNKLVESGKCPSFPYYYGCINGEDPNYHHDITDEYDMVSRTKWFRQRVKTDFDLLILEGDEMDEAEKEMVNKMHRQQSHHRFMSQDGGNSSPDSHNYDEEDNEEDDEDDDDNDEDEEDYKDDDKNEDDEFKAYKKYISKSLGIGLEDSLVNDEVDGEVDDEEDIEKALDFLDKNSSDGSVDGGGVDGGGADGGSVDGNGVDGGGVDGGGVDGDGCHSSKSDHIIPIDEIDSTLNNILTDMEDRTNTGTKGHDDFIKNIDDVDLDIQLENEMPEDPNKVPPIALEVVSENHLDDDLIEVLSDIDKNGMSMSDFEDNSSNNQYYLKCTQIPVNLCMMEKLDQTLDNLLDDGYNMPEVEWFSVFFQVAFGLATAQKYFSFVHNDLHSSNVMFKATELRNLFFQIGNTYYRVPTFGKITKIIDFARGTFKLGDRWIFSDQFKEDGDAWGQYDYPLDGTLANCEHKPNPSFDLVRLSTTIIQRLDDVPNVRHFVETITKDDYDNSLCYEEDTFQLYIDIAHNAHNAIPIEVLARPEFECFKVSRDRVPKGAYVFKY